MRLTRERRSPDRLFAFFRSLRSRSVEILCGGALFCAFASVFAQSARADECAQIDGGPALLEVAKIFVERVPVESHTIFLSPLAQVLDQTIVHWCDRGAFAGDLRCHTLSDFTGSSPVHEDVELRLPLNINESWRSDEASRIYALFGGCGVKVANRRDSVTPNSDVANKPRRAGAIHDARVRDQDVVRGGLS